MIGRIRGELVELEGSLALVEAGGVGYEVLLPDQVAIQLPPLGSEVILMIRQIIREDSVSLYGFASTSERRLFDLLLTVKGCGPKVGLALIGQVGEDSVISSIVNQDARTLVRATGVGLRLAERVILELKDKIQEEALKRRIEGVTSQSGRNGPSDELVDALLSLGYRRPEAEPAADAARQTEGDIETQLKHALRLLQKTGSSK